MSAYQTPSLVNKRYLVLLKREQTLIIFRYAAVAIQNWNNYMNSMNTAISFASSILSLKLPEIVADLYPRPTANGRKTSLETVVSIFSGVLSLVSFTGTIATVSNSISIRLSFVNERIQPPAEPDRFLGWGDIASSLATNVKDY